MTGTDQLSHGGNGVRAYEIPEEWMWHGLGDCPRGSLRWAALAYRAGLFEGRREILEDIAQAGRASARLARRILAQPDWDTIRGLREVDRTPCSAKCRRCSQCIAYEAWYLRGRRDYLGVEREAALANQSEPS